VLSALAYVPVLITHRACLMLSSPQSPTPHGTHSRTSHHRVRAHLLPVARGAMRVLQSPSLLSSSFGSTGCTACDPVSWDRSSSSIHRAVPSTRIALVRAAPTSRRCASASASTGTRYDLIRCHEQIPSLKPHRSLLLESALPSRFHFRPCHRLHRCRTACSSLRGRLWIPIRSRALIPSRH
jgi:hypothetical protein